MSFDFSDNNYLTLTTFLYNYFKPTIFFKPYLNHLIMSSRFTLTGVAAALLLTIPAAGGQSPDKRTSAAEAASVVSLTQATAKPYGRQKPRVKGQAKSTRRASRPAIERKAPSSNLTLYAAIYCEQPIGVYSCSTQEYGFEPVQVDDRLDTYYSGVYYDGTFLNITDNPKTAYKWSTDSWEILSSGQSELIAGPAMAADPVDGTIYACSWNIFGNAYDFVTIDPDNFYRSSTICAMETGFVAFCFDQNGTLWGFSGNGDLYTINKTTGAVTLKGNTGVDSYYGGAAVVDPATGLCYWMTDDWPCALYEVDLSTATASLLYELENDEEVGALFLLPDAPEAGAPGAPESPECTFPDGSLSGTVMFSAPTEFSDGNQGAGELRYSITVNQEPLADGDCSWGENLSVNYTAPERGQYALAITFSTDAGDSKAATSSLWIGPDNPRPVANVKAERTGSSNIVSWNASEGSAHGGYLPVDEIVYRVTRQPDNYIVAEATKETSVTDELPDGASPTLYTYDVTARWDEYASETVSSRPVMVGAVYYNAFDTADDFNGQFTSKSLINEGSTWEYSSYHKAMSVNYNEETAVSAWASTTKGLELKAGTAYTLEFTVWCSNDSYTERLSVYINKSNQPQVLYSETPLIEKLAVNFEKPVAQTIKQEFIPESDGVYYLTFTGCSPVDCGTLYVNNILLYCSPVMAVPAAPVISANLEDNLLAKITVIAPDADTDGQALSSLSRITLSRNGVLVHTFTDPKPGETLYFEETLPAAGSYTYSAVAISGNGASEAASILLSAIEPSVPRAPSAITVTETENPGEVTLTWSAPSLDSKNQPLQPGSLTYSVYMQGTAEPVVKGLTETSYTFRAVAPDTQKFCSFSVSATNNVGESSPAPFTDPQPLGKPDDLPYTESFAGMTFTNAWVSTSDDDYSTGEWLLVAASETPHAAPQDNDGGMLAFIAEFLDDTAVITSGKINLGTSDKPRLSFWYYAQNSKAGKDQLDVFVSDGTSFKRLDSFTMRDEERTGWTKRTIDLDAYSGKTIQIRFRGVSFRTENFMLIDRVEISGAAIDLAANSILAPASVPMGNSFTVEAAVANNSASAVEDYHVALFIDDQPAGYTLGVSIPAGGMHVFPITVDTDASWPEEAEIRFEVVCAADEIKTNDCSETVSVRILDTELPTVTSLGSALTDCLPSHVFISWEPPMLDKLAPAPFTENFESFEPFAINPACDWTFIDGDGEATYGPSTFYEGAYDPKAFVVIDANHFNVTYTARSGHLYLAAYCAQKGTSDDWMISPELNGEAQTITFYARSYTAQYKESFEILASAKGSEKADFTTVATHTNLPDEWTLYSAQLPEGTRHFAIHYTSENAFGFFVDDIRFTSKIHPASYFVIEGYNVFRNGKRINGDTVYDIVYDAGEYTYDDRYSVSVVYDRGESARSVEIGPGEDTGVSSQAAQSFSAKATDGGIAVEADGAYVTVSTPDGRTTWAGNVSGNAYIPAPTGVYLVSDGNSVAKVLVR